MKKMLQISCTSLVRGCALLGVSAALLLPAICHASSPTPGGKKYHVAAIGYKNSSASNEHVHIAQVTFWGSLDGQLSGANNPTRGRVTWSGWVWKKDAAPGQPGYCDADSSGTTATSACAQTGGGNRYSTDGGVFNNGRTYQKPAINGVVLCPTGYTGSATESKTGDFNIVTSGGETWVHILWSNGGWEDWNYSVINSDFVKLYWRNSNQGYNTGVMAGSNSDFSVRRAMGTIITHARVGALDLPSYTVCGSVTWMINESHYDREEISPCSCSPKRSYLNNWVVRISANDRRDCWHSWCQCLAWDNNWYSGGTHQKALLQAIDDNGNFRGYVGVQADRGMAHADVCNFLDI